MSHFTRPPFHKPSPFDLPRAVHPLTPPETEAESFAALTGPSPHPDMYSNLGSETPTSRPLSRKPSSLTYVNSGIRSDPRFNGPKAATRWLVVVSPPPALALENGSSMFLNPSRRDSQGVLLPLFPSLSRQVSAIAREYSFPSTSGICVFLRMPDVGVSYAPRLLEESWSILWSEVLFEGRSASGNSIGGLPIAGRLEFDLDLRKARWYDSWITAIRRELESTPLSTSPSIAANHLRDESRTTYHSTMDHHLHHDDAEEVHIQTHHPKGRVSRHIPRKLSLIERLESVSSVRSMSRPASNHGLSPPQQNSLALHSLSPVPQEDEPKSAIKVLETKVENWRASAAFASTPLTRVGQTTLDPMNMPNSVLLPELDSAAEDGQELNLDDFAWSISSAGPPSEFPWSAVSLDSERVPSVHLANRLEGSVCLTPSTCTSWGPSDHSIASPVSGISRLPSPDIAHRGYDYAPLTPSTATSWGPQSEWLDSPANSEFHFRRAPSLDLGRRAMSSRPCTPSTATSWGAPSEYPSRPPSPSYVRTPDVGHRTFDTDGDARPFHSAKALQWRHVWPYNATSMKAGVQGTWQHVWPYTENSDRNSGGSSTWQHVWPYNAVKQRDDKNVTWKFVWPYQRHTLDIRQEAESGSTVDARSGYPFFDIYPAVYPHFDLYPLQPVTSGSIDSLHTHLRGAYPQLIIYPVVYPTFEIYPGNVVAPQEMDSSTISVTLPKSYPAFDIYPIVYPAFEIYPGHIVQPQTNVRDGLSTRLMTKYPAFGIYPVVYPAFEIYPGHIVHPQADASGGLTIALAANYPSFDIYPAVYPAFEIYPGHILDRQEDAYGEISVRLTAKYPTYSIYPAVYPSFEIYPGNLIGPQVEGQDQLSVTLPTHYPVLDIYPAVYPHLVIYPPVTQNRVIARSRRSSRSISIKLPCTYPHFDIYPPVYPNNLLSIYPPSGQYHASLSTRSKSVEVTLRSHYPYLNLYPPVYPHLLIYPEVADASMRPSMTVQAIACYPHFDIYPAVYPYFDIYRSGVASTPDEGDDVGPISVKAAYPTFKIYSPVYPHFDIYNEGGAVDMAHRSNRQLPRRPTTSVSARDSLLASVKMDMAIMQRVRQSRKTHKELHESVMARLTARKETMEESQRRQVMSMDGKDKNALKASEVILDSPRTRSVGAAPSPESLPVRPSEIRRAASFDRAIRPAADVPSDVRRTGSLGRLNFVDEGSPARRVGASPLRPSPIIDTSLEARQDALMSGDVSPVKRRPARRDSIVLEKARHWGGNSSPSQPVPASQLTMDELSAFPMPPLPPLPAKPSINLNRPISKIDRSKFPFH